MEGDKHADWVSVINHHDSLVGCAVVYFTDPRDSNNKGGIDLWRTFGDEFKITVDPSCTNGMLRTDLDPWYFQIPCKYGTIWPWGRRQIAIDIDYHDQIANKVRAIPGVWAAHDGDREKTLVFDVSLFRQIANIVLPRKRRRLSADQRAACIEKLATYRFS